MNRKLHKRMKNKLIILPAFLVLLQLGSSFAQTGIIDSLNTNLTFANDTEKIDILIKLSFLTQNISYQQSIDYVTEAKKIAVGYHNLADFHFRLAHFNKAVDLNKKALEYYKNCSNIKGEIQILWQLGDAYFAMDKISPALETLQKGIDLGIRSGGRESELVIIEQTIGKIYSKIGNYDKAMCHLQNALNYSVLQKPLTILLIFS